MSTCQFYYAFIFSFTSQMRVKCIENTKNIAKQAGGNLRFKALGERVSGKFDFVYPFVY